MKPRGPLMIEHRLIEKVIALAGKMAEQIRETGSADTGMIYSIVDFIRTYADRTHHGKEEDILFKELSAKAMSDYDSGMMQDLINEHATARKKVGELFEATKAYEAGKKDKIDIIAERLEFLNGFYPRHIEKEDKTFFPNSEKYFSQQELGNLLEEFSEFDRGMIHEKYKSVYESLLKEASE